MIEVVPEVGAVTNEVIRAISRCTQAWHVNSCLAVKLPVNTLNSSMSSFCVTVYPLIGSTGADLFEILLSNWKLRAK